MPTINIHCRFIPGVTWRNEGLPETQGPTVYRIDIAEHITQLNEYAALLSNDELTRAGKYHQQKDHDRFVISRALLRLTLANITDLSPVSLAFAKDNRKKPYIVNSLANPLHFNVSHSGNYILVAVADQEVGVDVEFLDPTFDYDDIIDYSLNEDEIRLVNASVQPVSDFFCLWSRKESLCKGTGKGIGNHLTEITCLTGSNPIESTVIDSNRDWYINSFDVAAGYVGNVASPFSGDVHFYDLGIGRYRIS